MIRGEGVRRDPSWTELLAKDYVDPRYHISFARAVGRRLRRTYAWIFVIQAISYYGKLAIHPAPLTSFTDVLQRAAIGPIPGSLVIAPGVLFHAGLSLFPIFSPPPPHSPPP